MRNQEREQPCPRELDLMPATRGQGFPRSNLESTLRRCSTHLDTAIGAPASGTAALRELEQKNAVPEAGAPPHDFPVGGSVKIRPAMHGTRLTA